MPSKPANEEPIDDQGAGADQAQTLPTNNSQVDALSSPTNSVIGPTLPVITQIK